jgi:DNA polymerase I-like protein with 3'-5' exonuclease and polymerase domains
MLPSQLPEIDTVVALDSESNGIYPDDGARVATVSVAYTDPRTGLPVSLAWPFNQGIHGKPQMEQELRVPVPWVGPDKSPKRWAKARWGDYAGPDPNLPQSEWDALCQWLVSRPLGLVGHNLLHDAVIMRNGAPHGWEGVDLQNRLVWDTMLGQRVLDPEHLLGLKPAAQRLFGHDPDERDAVKEWLKSHKQPVHRYDLVDWRVMSPYAASDTELTLALAVHQWRRFNAGEAPFARMSGPYGEMATLKTLLRMELRGVPYKKLESLAWADKLDVEAAGIERELPFGDTPTQVRQFFFGSGQTERGKVCLELKPLKMTAGSKPDAKVYKAPVPSVDAEVMEELANRDVPAAARYREWSVVTDSVSRYYRGYAEATGPDGRLRTRFRQTGTRTGRLSCERTNLMAIPHDMRIVASGNKVLAEADSPRDLIYSILGWQCWHMDLSQAELRVASLYAKCQRMLDIIGEGRDPHGETATALFGVTPTSPDWKKMRGVGKRGNFSLIFGIGWAKFRADVRKQTGVDLGDAEARRVVTEWNVLYPEFKVTLGVYERMARRDGFTTIRDGIRRYYSDYEKLSQDYYKAFNSKVQGNLGYFGREWMVRVDAYLIDQGIALDHGLLLNIHDALMVETPVDRPELAVACADIARAMWPRWFPGVPGGVDLERWEDCG